jgi:hypothetical protein
MTLIVTCDLILAAQVQMRIVVNRIALAVTVHVVIAAAIQL